ncbi:unnamed protein product [Heterobilharzia americana]|nr:unnamed protein product [Heterobilharzia americana]
MLYTTSLMKFIPQTPNKVENDKFIFSSTPEISRETNRSRDFFGLVKKRSAQEKDVCARHKLYHHNPRCHHHQCYEQQNGNEYHSRLYKECYPGCGFLRGSTSKSSSVIRKTMSKQLSLPVESAVRDKSPYSSNRSIQTRSYLGEDFNVQSNLYSEATHSNINIHESNKSTTRPASWYVPEYSSDSHSELKGVLQRPLSHAKTIGDIDMDPASDVQCSPSPIPLGSSKRKYFDEEDMSNFFGDVSKDTFKDRLLYFPTIGNRMLLKNPSKLLLYPNIDQTNEMAKYNSTGGIDAKSVMPKKELKFAVPQFLMPILCRRSSSQIVSVRKLPDRTFNLENKLLKRRKTIKERFQRLQSDLDSGRFWYKLNRRHTGKESKPFSTGRSRSSILISVHDRDTGDSNSRSSNTSCDDCRRVTINVSGLKFETWLTVLERHPTTLLGDYNKRKPFYDEYRKEYFFDRHRPSFEAIFNYYQYGGRLKRPATVSDDVFLTELEFFQIESEALDIYKKNEGYVPDIIILPENHFKRKLWMLFEYPETSVLAFTFSIASVIFTVISIILFCIETLPVYAQTHCEPGAKPNFRDPFFIIETLCTFWFTLEIFVRFISCPSKKVFIKDIKNLIDLAAIVPYYITLFNVLISFSCEGAKNSASLAFLRVIRLIRVFKLTKHSSGLQVLVLTFKESIEGLSLFLVAFIVCILVFSSTIYYVEIDRKGSQIESIPDAFWWAVITMCTVGYGDKVPKGPLGKVVGSVCAVAGVLTLAIQYLLLQKISINFMHIKLVEEEDNILQYNHFYFSFYSLYSSRSVYI